MYIYFYFAAVQLGVTTREMYSQFGLEIDDGEVIYLLEDCAQLSRGQINSGHRNSTVFLFPVCVDMKTVAHCAVHKGHKSVMAPVTDLLVFCC